MKIKTIAATLLLILSAGFSASAQRASDFNELCDSLTVRAQERFTVRSRIRVKKVLRRDGKLDLYFDRSLSDFAWHDADQKWFRREVLDGWPTAAKGMGLGDIFVDGISFKDLSTPEINENGSPVSYRLKTADTRTTPTVERVGAGKYVKGLYGRHIVVWQSHGRYWHNDLQSWMWQRATVQRTVEDLYTQSYVLPFVIPMLENAGAYVMTPRERDTNSLEVITDNDPAFEGDRSGLMRRKGSYSETGKWSDAGTGFADAKEEYEIADNPFRMGTARQVACSTNPSATARWTPNISKRGRYAVYVSYKTLPESTNAAYYTVSHLGGKSVYKVNQQRGGGTWMYVGTFEFGPGNDCYVELDNRGSKSMVVTADAVKIGGGMGKINRGGGISGVPSYAEGASYWMPWAGADSTLRQWNGDYNNDYASRGAWTQMMKNEKNIPFDLSFAFHTDAGTTPNDSIVGTLAIYTLKAEGKRTFLDGKGDRMSCRLLTEYVQDEIVDDIRAQFDPKWSRRQLWDRSYSESRTTDVPGLLLELLSHQNFADMKYGLDPAFRFTVSRAIYKGMLKFLSAYYGCSYVVQPLPVHDFACRFSANGNAALSWQPAIDDSEPTASAKSYIVYTRVDDGAFDEGKEVRGTSVEMPIESGHIYSYKVVAVNDGGLSFPSEILAIGKAGSDVSGAVLVVNNFTRISAPTWIDTPDYAGFMGREDSGVPYMTDITYIGENYEFRRSLSWMTDENPGFGASYRDHATEIVAGNTFDYPYVHGKALMAIGKSFCSMSSETFMKGGEKADALDLICGKQVTTKIGAGYVPNRYEIFPAAMRSAIKKFTADGGSIFISGADIATDAWDQVYPFEVDESRMEATQNFITSTLGYKLGTTHGSSSGKVGAYSYYNEMNPDCYCVECPDGISPSGLKGKVWIRYATGVSAGVQFRGDGYRVVSFGVPLECIKGDEQKAQILKDAFEFIEK